MALSQFRFMIASLKFFIDIILPAALLLSGSIQPLRESCTGGTRKCKSGQGVDLSNVPLPCADCIEIRDPQSTCYS